MNRKAIKTPLLSRGGVARSAGVVLVKKFYGNRPTPPRLRVFWWLRNFYFFRAATPLLLRRGHALFVKACSFTFLVLQFIHTIYDAPTAGGEISARCSVTFSENRFRTDWEQGAAPANRNRCP